MLFHVQKPATVVMIEFQALISREHKLLINDDANHFIFSPLFRDGTELEPYFFGLINYAHFTSGFCTKIGINIVDALEASLLWTVVKVLRLDTKIFTCSVSLSVHK